LLKVSGKIVGINERKITPKEGQTFNEFIATTLYIADGNGKPLEVKTTKNGRKVGEQIEAMVYIEVFKNKYDAPGYNIREVKEK